MRNHYELLVKMNDRSVKGFLANQCLEEGHELYGITPNHGLGYVSAEQGIGGAATLMMAYYTPESEYYRNDLLLERGMLALKNAMELQHEDGSIDLPQTNFSCAATMAFTIFHMGPAMKLMRAFNQHTAIEDEADALYTQFLNRAADGMLAGGFHTPNHRWVISSALSYCYNLLNRQDCLDEINLYLNEGMDCDEEGEYTERSAGTYNIICNNALIVLAQELNMPELLDHVRRNLHMVMKYIEPDNLINTLNSTRQDVGTAPNRSSYYSNFLNMAILTGDQEFAWMADDIAKDVEASMVMGQPLNTPYPHYHQFILQPERMETMLALTGVEPDLTYDKYFEVSGLVRWRKGDVSATLIKERPLFAKFQWANHTIHLRLAGSFYARAQFRAQEITPIENGYRLTFHDRWGYKRPLAEKPATSVWREMDHSKREQAMMKDFDFCVEVRFIGERSIEVTLNASGCERVPSKFEIMLQPEGRYIKDDMEIRMHGGDYMYQKKGEATYCFNDNRSVKISGGFFDHYYGEHMRGTLPVDSSSAFVAMTAYSPFTQKVTFEFK